MYKMLLTHELLPGKLPDFVAWCKRADVARAKQNPAYKPPNRHVSVFGSAHHVMVEWEVEKLPEQPLVFAEGTQTKDQKAVLAMVVPGSTQLLLFKRLEITK